MLNSVLVLHLIVFVDLLAVGLIVPLIPNHLRSKGGTHIHVGLLGSIYAAFQLVSGPLLGSLSDLKGRKSILLLTLIISGISYTLKGFNISVLGHLCLRAVLGIFKQTQMLSRALVPEYVKSENRQSEIYGKMAAISGMGITLGPLIGGHIIEIYPEHGFQYIAVAVGLCFLTNAGLVYILPKSRTLTPTRRKNPKRRKQIEIEEPPSMIALVYDSLKKSVAQLFLIEWETYWDVLTLKALIGFAMGIYFSNYGTYLKSEYKLSPKYIGYIISFQAVVGSLSSYFINNINSFYKNDFDYSLRMIHVFVLISLALAGIILSHNIYSYVFWLIPLAVGNAIGRLISLEMILQRSQGHHRATLIGASNSVRSASGIVAPMAAGYISEYVGVAYPIYASLLATLVGIILSYYVRVADDYNFSRDDDEECEDRNEKIKLD